MITDGKARRIAMEWHSGMHSILYSFGSTGFIDASTKEVIIDEIISAASTNNFERHELYELFELLEYVIRKGYRGTVPGWHLEYE